MDKTLLPKTRLQLAEEFGISKQTLMRRLKKKGIGLPRGLVHIKRQNLVYETPGYPSHGLKAAFLHVPFEPV